MFKSAAAACAPPRTALYRRQPERILRYRAVQTRLATWLELSCDTRQVGSAPAHGEQEFRRYLEYGILANDFARVRCAGCGHDFLIA